MLNWTITFLLLTCILGILGFGADIEAAKFFCVVALTMFIACVLVEFLKSLEKRALRKKDGW